MHQARSILGDSPSPVMVDEPGGQRYPTPLMAAGIDQVCVGRIRRDATRAKGLSLFITADDLREVAATNAVQVAQLLL